MAKKPQPKSEEGTKLVRMVRDGKTADVHPDEVDNFAAGGWVKE
jgi:hypothetical protein